MISTRLPCILERRRQHFHTPKRQGMFGHLQSPHVDNNVGICLQLVNVFRQDFASFKSYRQRTRGFASHKHGFRSPRCSSAAKGIWLRLTCFIDRLGDFNVLHKCNDCSHHVAARHR